MKANLRVAASALRKDGLRTGLSVLAIGIGIAAVICTLAIGAASARRIEQQIDGLGEDLLWIRAGSLNVGGVRSGFGGARTLTSEDAEAMVAQVPGVSSCSPIASGREQLIAGGANWNSRYQAVLPSYFRIRRRTAVAGTLFSDYDLQNYTRVVVLGPSVAQRLFGEANPVGLQIRMGKFPFQVIGVLDSRGADRSGVDRDDTVLLPFSTANRTLDRRTWVSDIVCAVSPVEFMTSAEQAAAVVLRRRHRLMAGELDDFNIEHPRDIIELRSQATRTMTAMLTGIATVALVVGGVGIMNIMLVAVTERRREIGVRLSVGARTRDIRWQFLAEAGALGLLGAVLGIAIGWVGAQVITARFGWTATVSLHAVAVAVAAAMGTAVLFGYLPARQASTLDPIEAIRIDD